MALLSMLSHANFPHCYSISDYFMKEIETPGKTEAHRDSKYNRHSWGPVFVQTGQVLPATRKTTLYPFLALLSPKAYHRQPDVDNNEKLTSV
ncbi:hypothetical protein J6590_008927 [Homalodisca vitripennis]|nr:hypothetical protein J6590_008927 [Homalodisca vitripennis]